jgi:hypothetical protein
VNATKLVYDPGLIRPKTKLVGINAGFGSSKSSHCIIAVGVTRIKERGNQCSFVTILYQEIYEEEKVTI